MKPLYPFYYQLGITMTRLKQLQRYIKKYSKFGAYIVAIEHDKNLFDVELFCPVIHTDILGNRAIARDRSHRTS